MNPLLLAALLCWVSFVARAEAIVFPPDTWFCDLRPDYGAKDERAQLSEIVEWRKI